ncbi:MAG: TIGR03086 family metal-binding protein [Microthrixaceae bacterium]
MTSSDDSTSVDAIFRDGLDYFGSVVERLEDDRWDRPSRCEGWTNLDVLCHVGAVLDMATDVAGGRQHQFRSVDRPAEHVAGSPRAYWSAQAAKARAAVADADLQRECSTEMGTMTIGQRLGFPAIDLHVHAWDIGKDEGIDLTIPVEVVALSERSLGRFPEDVVRSMGVFGPRVELAEDASSSDRFLAFTGRDPR